jgi:hypothetical protein
LSKVDALFARLIAAIAAGTLDAELRADIVTIAKEARKADEVVAGTASWEMVRWDDDYASVAAPLRALGALADCIEAGADRITHNAILVYEISPIVEWALRKGGTIFLDATLPQALRELINARGGVVAQRTVPQNMCVTRYTGGSLYPRGKVSSKGYKDDSLAFMRELERIAQDFPLNTAFLTHRARLAAAAEAYAGGKTPEETAAAFEVRTGRKIGWYGAHDRGHNNWREHNIVCVGLPLISSDSYGALYAAERAALLRAGVQWPAFNGELDDGENSNGVPLPRDPHVRKWLLDYYAATLSQAAGRARAARHDGPPLEIALLGGIDSPEMDEALERRGLVVSERRPNTWHLRPGQRSNSATVEDICGVIMQMKAAGLVTSRRTVAAYLADQGMAARKDKIDAAVRMLRESGVLPPARAGRRAEAAPTPAEPPQKLAPKSYIDPYRISGPIKSVDPESLVKPEGDTQHAPAAAPCSFRQQGDGEDGTTDPALSRPGYLEELWRIDFELGFGRVSPLAFLHQEDEADSWF